MSVQKMYERLVEKWGRDLANEIMAKRLSKPRKKQHGQKKWSPVLPGSFESGKRR